MFCHLDIKTSTSGHGSRPYLTEQNLLLHVTNHQNAPQNVKAQTLPRAVDTRHAYTFNGYDESEDGDSEAMRDVALERAASLEALQAYGGCFVSGFLAMQDPLPWLSTATITSTSSRSESSAGRPRPDSETLSSVDVQQLLNGGRKRSWKSMRRLRSVARRSRK